MPRVDFTEQLLQNEIIKVCQSKKMLRLDQSLEIKCKIARTMSGSGFETDQDEDDIENDNDLLSAKRCVIRVPQPKDNLCALRAIICAKHYLTKDIARMDNFRREGTPQLENEVKELANTLGLENKAMGHSDIAKIESYLKDFQITVYDQFSTAKTSHQPLYRGPPASAFIYLLFFKKHYWPITSAKAFFKTKHFCHYCKTATNHIELHRCQHICALCKRAECKNETRAYVRCLNCDLNCSNETCKGVHTKFCPARKICEHCGVKYVYKHNCKIADLKYCTNCKTKVNYDHRCFIVPGNLDSHDYNKGYIFFDFEASQEHYEHVPNLVIAHKYGNTGTLLEKNYFYNDGVDVSSVFCNWLFKQSGFLAVAHNFKGYDGIFVMNYLIKNIMPGTPQPEIVNQGNKILSLKHNKLKLIDSFMFLPMALSDFSSTFCLPESKGYFPHLFNVPSNQGYVGCLPDVKYYGVDHMSVSKREICMDWYERNKRQEFNFRQALFEYCEIDVELLAKGCLAFRKIIKKATRIDPFATCITLASLCHTIYRHNHMIPKSIAVIPEVGYNPSENCSRKSQLWLKYESEKRNIRILHAKNGGEHKIGPYKLDGFSDGVGFEFHGCLFHGCIKCYSPRTKNLLSLETMGEIYSRHCDRIQFIKRNVTQLVEIWECEWDRLVKLNDEVRAFVNQQPTREAINPREALYGGRTNAAKLYHRVENDEKIMYIDVCSLYPHVMVKHEYPVGHPKIITENFSSVHDYFGIIKCSILAPRKLYFPVLPVKMDNKLLFPLCATCAKLKTSTCDHSDSDRCLEGVWCTPEIVEALNAGYKIVTIHEVWHWKQRSSELFQGYINTFLKIKQEASGYPSWARTDTEKANYIEKYFEHEQIKLTTTTNKDASKINKNNGLRKISKLLLNTLWGRFGMNLNKSKIKVLT